MSRLAQVSSSSSTRAARRATPARLAAAGTLTSGPGCRPSSRNILAAGWLRAWWDQENTDRMLAPGAQPGSQQLQRLGLRQTIQGDQHGALTGG